MNDRQEWKVLKSFGHMERMSGLWLTKRVYESEVLCEVVRRSQTSLQYKYARTETSTCSVHRLRAVEGLYE